MEERLGYLHVWCLPSWRDAACSELMFLFPGMDVHSRLDVSGFSDCFVLTYAPAGERRQRLERMRVLSSGEILFDWSPLTL